MDENTIQAMNQDATQVLNGDITQSQTPAVCCPQCGSSNVSFQMFQENAGTTTVSKTKSKYKEKGHGIIWWLLIGWWWWMIDLMLWICAFPLRLIAQLTRKKKYKGTATTVQQQVNQISYKTMCLCGNCGNTWVKNDLMSNTMQNVAKDTVKDLKRKVK